MKRKVVYKVVYEQTVGFCGEFRYDFLKSFDSYEEAEQFIMNGDADKYGVADLQIQKVFKLEKE